MNIKWDNRFLVLAEHIAGWSKDPSTQVGAVIVRPNNSVVSVGFNGFPIGIRDNKERYEHRKTKYELIVHGEINAITFAQEPLNGHTLYTWPFLPCARSAGIIIQNGIKRVVALSPTLEIEKRWGKSLTTTRTMFKEVGIDYFEI